MYIICGLGNPGKKYEGTRHNAGFMALDALASENNININKLKFKAMTGEGRIGGERVLLMKPLTYMNLSGEAVREAVDFYKIDLENLIIVYDDIDIDAGTLRIRKKGSAGSHNGMKSIIQHLGCGDFPRIRVGVSKQDEHMDLASYVLSTPRGDEAKSFKEGIERAAMAIEAIVGDSLDNAMNRYNG